MGKLDTSRPLKETTQKIPPELHDYLAQLSKIQRDNLGDEVWGFNTPGENQSFHATVLPNFKGILYVQKQVFELISLLKLLNKLKNSDAKIDLKIIKKAISENANIIYYLGEIIIQQTLSNMVGNRINLPQAEQAKVKAEIDKFIKKDNVKDIIGKLLLANTLKDIISQLEIILVFSGKMKPGQTSLPGDVTLNQTRLAAGKLYNNDLVMPLVDAFFDEYNTGNFPTIKKYIAGKSEKSLSPHYQEFISDKKLRKKMFQALLSDKLPPFLTRTGKRLQRVVSVYERASKLSRFIGSRPRRQTEAEYMEAAGEFIDIFDEYLEELKKFLSKNPEAWEYFKDTGLKFSHHKESGKSMINSENAFRMVFGRGFGMGFNVDYLEGPQFIEGFFQAKVIGNLILSLFLETYNSNGEVRVNTRIKRLLKKHGISFHRTAFATGLNLRKSKRPQLKAQIRRITAFLIALDSGNIKGTEFRRWVSTFKERR